MFNGIHTGMRLRTTASTTRWGGGAQASPSKVLKHQVIQFLCTGWTIGTGHWNHGFTIVFRITMCQHEHTQHCAWSTSPWRLYPGHAEKDRPKASMRHLQFKNSNHILRSFTMQRHVGQDRLFLCATHTKVPSHAGTQWALAQQPMMAWHCVLDGQVPDFVPLFLFLYP